MKCPKCFCESNDNDIYCRNCGVELKTEKKCPRCGQDNTLDSDYCVGCGLNLNPSNNVGTSQYNYSNNVDLSQYNSSDNNVQQTGLVFGIVSAAVSLCCYFVVFITQITCIILGIIGIVRAVKGLKSANIKFLSLRGGRKSAIM